MLPFGKYSYGDPSVIWDSSGAKLHVGKFCSIGARCSFIFANHDINTITTFPNPIRDAYSKGNIVIRNDVWIGANVSIMAGVTIHNGAVIGANAIVTKDVPPYAIVVGNPSRIIKYRFTEEQRTALESLKIWDLPDAELKSLNLWTTNVEEFVEEFKRHRDRKY